MILKNSAFKNKGLLLTSEHLKNIYVFSQFYSMFDVVLCWIGVLRNRWFTRDRLYFWLGLCESVSLSISQIKVNGVKRKKRTLDIWQHFPLFNPFHFSFLIEFLRQYYKLRLLSHTKNMFLPSITKYAIYNPQLHTPTANSVKTFPKVYVIFEYILWDKVFT